MSATSLSAISCIVDSCRNCEHCHHGEEQFCEKGWTVVFNSPDKHLGGMTYGGFSRSIVADENYVLHVPESLDLPSAAPILCAGITVYSPLKHWKAGPGKNVGIPGMGTVFTTSPGKAADAKRWGASEVVVTTNSEQMRSCPKLDMILDTVSAKHDTNA